MVHLIGKDVEIVANQLTYRGRLVEVNEREVYLETELGWVTILVENISNLEEATS